MKCDCCGKELTNWNNEANILICKECAEKISQSTTLFYTTDNFKNIINRKG